jgi:hypothetical protein
MSPEQRAQVQARVIAANNVVSGANRLKDTGYLQVLGFNRAPEIDTLPKFGSPLREVGPWEGLITPNVSTGDYKTETKDKRTIYLPRESINENELELLKDRGAPLGH